MSETQPIKAITTPVRLEYDFTAGQAATLFLRGLAQKKIIGARTGPGTRARAAARRRPAHVGAGAGGGRGRGQGHGRHLLGDPRARPRTSSSTCPTRA